MQGLLRLMSPTRRRLIELNLRSARDRAIDEQLRQFGWMDYLGPGEADSRGWFIPSTDPSIEPPLPHRPPKMSRRPPKTA